ncbi:XRE family transcriptional regulator [Clostridiales bacterium S5-A14a]|nr:XRE family transcriptional regulator [Clostridiales bacterium S5-A14a]
MAKTANLYARIEPDLKEQAEQILNAIGLPPSSAITMFYKQVVMQQGLPFDARLNYRKPMDISSMTKDEFDFELEKGYQDAVTGRTKPIDEVFEYLEKEFGI